MPIALNRRVPRTKSVFDRTSSRRYSSLDFGSNDFYDTHKQNIIVHSVNNGNMCQNYLNLINSVLRPNDDAIISSNGHDDFTISLANENDSDEYEYCILQTPPRLVYFCFFLLGCIFLLFFSFIVKFYKFNLGENHGSKVLQVIDKACDEVHLMRL